MDRPNFVSEAEAAAYAGVSIATLGRFAEAGYLQVDSDSPGLKRYSRDQISALFGITKPAATVRTQESTSQPTEKVTEVFMAGKTKPVEVKESEPIRVEQQALNPEPISPPESQMNQVEHDHILEVERLRHLVKLHERILDLKDSELIGLKEQNEWLKKRIERLEEKADRDQLLLLSERQTFKKLLDNYHERQKSSVRLALEWLGLVSTPRTVDVVDVSGSAPVKTNQN